MREIKRLGDLYNHRDKTSLEKKLIDVNCKTMIIVDDGAATGSTIIPAIRSVRKNMNPYLLIIAIPISPMGTINKLKNEGIDKMKVITSPQT